MRQLVYVTCLYTTPELRAKLTTTWLEQVRLLLAYEADAATRATIGQLFADVLHIYPTESVA